MTQKNHSFLIDVFVEVARQDPEAVLVLLGDGELQQDIQKKVSEKGLDKKVFFEGNVGNANEWYNAFDVFVLPSVWEGLPVVGVEAQANDLPCVFSDSITQEIVMTEKADFLSLTAPISEWASVIIAKFNDTKRNDNTKVITDHHYNIEFEAEKLQALYLKLYEESK